MARNRSLETGRRDAGHRPGNLISTFADFFKPESNAGENAGRERCLSPTSHLMERNKIWRESIFDSIDPDRDSTLTRLGFCEFSVAPVELAF